MLSFLTRLPASSPMNPEVRARDVLTGWAEQEVSHRVLIHCAVTFSSTLGSLPRPRRVLHGGGVRGQTSKQKVGPEVDLGCSLAPEALFLLGGTPRVTAALPVGGFPSRPSSPGQGTWYRQAPGRGGGASCLPPSTAEPQRVLLPGAACWQALLGGPGAGGPHQPTSSIQLGPGMAAHFR